MDPSDQTTVCFYHPVLVRLDLTGVPPSVSPTAVVELFHRFRLSECPVSYISAATDIATHIIFTHVHG